MNIEIRGHGLELTQALKRHVEHRVSTALDIHQSLIDQVQVRLADTNGPKGGVDKDCRINVKLRIGAVVTVDEQSADMYASIDKASDRAKMAVHKHIERAREPLGH